MSIIISILVSLLTAFLTALIKAWFEKHPLSGTYVSASAELEDYVASAKEDFLKKVRRRFWLGSKRESIASSLFDIAHSRLKTHSFLSPGGLVAAMTDGLDKLSPSELEYVASQSSEIRFKVLSNGLVQDGTAAYLLEPATGKITYRAAISIGKWFLSKTYNFGGVYKVDPTLLSPTNLSVGKVIQIGDLQMRVVSLNQVTAMLSLSLLGDIKASGTAILSVSTPVVSLNSVDATLYAYGLSLPLAVRLA